MWLQVGCKYSLTYYMVYNKMGASHTVPSDCDTLAMLMKHKTYIRLLPLDVVQYVIAPYLTKIVQLPCIPERRACIHSDGEYNLYASYRRVTITDLYNRPVYQQTLDHPHHQLTNIGHRCYSLADNCVREVGTVKTITVSHAMWIYGAHGHLYVGTFTPYETYTDWHTMHTWMTYRCRVKLYNADLVRLKVIHTKSDTQYMLYPLSHDCLTITFNRQLPSHYSRLCVTPCHVYRALTMKSMRMYRQVVTVGKLYPYDSRCSVYARPGRITVAYVKTGRITCIYRGPYTHCVMGLDRRLYIYNDDQLTIHPIV